MALKDINGTAILVGAPVVYAQRQGTARVFLKKGVVTGTSEGTKGNLPGDFVHIRTEGDRDVTRDPSQVAVTEGTKSGTPSKGKAGK